MNQSKESLAHHFFDPLYSVFPKLRSVRACPSLPDKAWLEVGIRRVISSSDSGRDFLSQLVFSALPEISLTHFFETLKSKRRLQLCREAATKIFSHLTSVTHDRLSSLRSLDGFDIYAGDGHWHAAASHDRKSNGKKYAIGHLYGLDLRHNALHHLQMADGTNKLKEHDMAALKRTEIEALRRGAPKGRKVLWIWDKAGIDFQQWYRWKHGSAVYFLSHAKDNMRPETLGEYAWCQIDPINKGIISDREVSTSQGVSIRQVIYCDPLTGKDFTFLTNLPASIAPGIVAQLYRMRWDAEKVFDEIKNKLGEKKGWASSENAKAMQATFLCITYNLLEASSIQLEEKYGITNLAEIDRKAKCLHKEIIKSKACPPPLYLRLQRFTQHSVKLIRWLRYHLWNGTSLNQALPQLEQIYSKL